MALVRKATFAETLRFGVEACEQIAKELRFDITKALDPLDEGDFMTIVARLASKLENAADEASAMETALDALDVNWEGMTSAQVDRVVSASNAALRAHYDTISMPAIEKVLTVEGPDMADTTRRAMKATYDFSIKSSLQQRDLAAEKAVRTTTTNFIRDQFGVRAGALSAKAREIAARGIERGLSPKDIGLELASGFEGQITKSRAYWEVVSYSFAVKARTNSQLYSYDDAGITEYEFVAVLDSVTTDQCRFYDGKTFAVGTGISKMEALNELEDPEDVKYANPWIKTGKDDNGAFLYMDKSPTKSVVIARIDRSGRGANDDRGEFSGGKTAAQLTRAGAPINPPLHGRCRSTTIPV